MSFDSRKKFILINGPSCAGKSTVIERLIKSEENFYKLSYDSQKWMFSKYSPKEKYQDVQTIVLTLADTVCGLGYNIVSDSGLHREYREELLRIPARHGYEIIEIGLLAKYELLLDRFRERVAVARANPNVKISNTSEERFKDLYDIYMNERNPNAHTFDTEVLSPDDLYQGIVTLLKEGSPSPKR